MGQTACCTPDSDNNQIFHPINNNQISKPNGLKYTPIQKVPKLTGYV
jgi:hypothetical protein